MNIKFVLLQDGLKNFITKMGIIRRMLMDRFILFYITAYSIRAGSSAPEGVHMQQVKNGINFLTVYNG